MTTSILLCDDSEDIRTYIKREIARFSDLVVVGEAADGLKGIELATALQPDLILLDLAMPVLDGAAALPAMLEGAPGVKVIVLSGLEKDAFQERLLSLGAVAYIEKGTSLKAIVDAIRVVSGLPPVPHRIQLSGDKERALFDLSHDLLCIARPDGFFEHLSPSWEQVLGWSLQELTERPFSEFVHPDDLASTEVESASVRAGNDTFSFRNRYRCKDGSYRWLSWTSRVVDDRVHAVARDVTAQIQVEEERAQALVEKSASESLRLAVLESALDCVVGMDLQGRFIEFNMAAEATFGYKRDEVLGKSVAELIIPERFRSAHREAIAHHGSAGAPSALRRRLEIEAMRSDGTEFPVELALTKVQLPTGPVFTAVIRDISTSKKMELELRQSEERFRSLVQNSRDVIAVIGASGLVSYISPTVESLSGFSPDEVIGTSGFAFIHPDDLEGAASELAEILSTPDATRTLEVRARTKQGPWIWIEIRAANRLDDASIQGIVLNYHDITERRVAADRLTESERWLKEAQAVAHFGSYVVDLDSGDVSWSAELSRLFGYDPEGRQPNLGEVMELVHPEDRDRVAQELAQCREESRTIDTEYRIVRPDGATRWVQARGKVRVEGQSTRLIGMAQDITVRKRAEVERDHALAKQKEVADQFKMLLDSTGEGIFGVDDDGVCTFINQAGAALFGGTPSQFVGKVMHHLTHHTHADGLRYPVEDCAIYRAFRTGEGSTVTDEVFWRLDGTYFPVEYSAFPMAGESMTGAVVGFKDVTERHAMELEIRRSEQFFRGAFDAARTGIALIDADGRSYVDVNQALCDMVGYTKTELMELDWLQLTHPDDREKQRVVVEEFLSGQADVKFVSKRYVCKNGRVIFVEISDSLVRSADGSPMYIVTHVTDVTERERLQAQLRQSQKMEAVGQLAGGIAHDFNNILAVILNYAEFLKEEMAGEDPRGGDVDEIVKAGERAATLVHQLLSFSRKELVEPRIMNLNEVVADLHELLRRSIGEDIELVFDAAEDLPPVKADPGGIEQVILNLAVNGRDAMPSGGVLEIRTRTEVVQQGHREGLLPGDYVLLSVMDTGNGMDPQTKERVFEPFFTTKGRGEGTGLGLATVYGIVKQANGGIYVDSEVGEGSVFTLYLPVSSGIVVDEVDDAPQGRTAGTERIVVVEDEDAVRELVCRLLTNNGYDVRSFSDGASALDYIRTHPDLVDLLLTDVVMPKMSGKELADLVTAVRPSIKTVFMSGYTDELIAQRGELDPSQTLIRKPFKPHDLLIGIRGSLDRTTA